MHDPSDGMGKLASVLSLEKGKPQGRFNIYIVGATMLYVLFLHVIEALRISYATTIVKKEISSDLSSWVILAPILLSVLCLVYVAYMYRVRRKPKTRRKAK